MPAPVSPISDVTSGLPRGGHTSGSNLNLRLLALAVLVAAASPAAAYDYHITVQPIQVRNDDGTLDPAQGQYPAHAIAVEAANKIFAQADADVTFLPTVYLDATDHLVIGDSSELIHLTTTPGHAQNADPLVLNFWMVQSAWPTAVQVPLLNANGTAVDGSVVDNMVVIPHGLGHNLNLDNWTDSGDPNNLMWPAPLTVFSLGDIYPDGLGRCHLTPDQIATIRASRFVTYLDLTPPAAPSLAVVDDEIGRQIFWQNPPDPDFAQTCLFRGLSPGFSDGEAVYCGDGTTYRETLCQSYYYRARSFDVHGNASAWSNEVMGRSPTPVPQAGPTALRLYPCQPNPFNPRTTIEYDLPEAGPVSLAVFDLAGRLVRTLVDESMPQGHHAAVWDGRDATDREVGSGAYLARLEFGGKVEVVGLGLVR